ncbi:unnamed protein product, partial [Prorocentrum cordatum]
MWNIGRHVGQWRSPSGSGHALSAASPAPAWQASACLPGALPGALPASAPSSSGDAVEQHIADLRAEDLEQLSAAHLERLVQTAASPTPDILASLLDDDDGGGAAAASPPPAAAGAPPLPAVVRLNVGGRLLTTTVQTLRRDPGSRLARMFGDEAQMRPPRDAQGHFCLDRDGRLFHHVLNFLRDGSPPIGLSRGLRLELLREAEFYGLGALHAALGGTQQPADLVAQAPAAEGARPPPSRASYARCGTATGLSRPGARLPAPPAPPLWADAACADFAPPRRTTRCYVRLRFGSEYSGDWIVTSPRQLPGVDYQLHNACIARSPIDALNKMCQAGYRPCEDPPSVPPVDDFYTDNWLIAMFRDVDSCAAAAADDPLGSGVAEQPQLSQTTGSELQSRSVTPSPQRHRTVSSERLASRTFSDLEGSGAGSANSAWRLCPCVGLPRPSSVRTPRGARPESGCRAGPVHGGLGGLRARLSRRWPESGAPR